MINLAVGLDDPVLGVDGALASASLWNVSNQFRFFANQSTVAVAVAEILGIPELNQNLVLHFVALEEFQFIEVYNYCIQESFPNYGCPQIQWL